MSLHRNKGLSHFFYPINYKIRTKGGFRIFYEGMGILMNDDAFLDCQTCVPNVPFLRCLK